jgi:regulator of sirC expression with transglutaminase-like and TPR domain
MESPKDISPQDVQLLASFLVDSNETTRSLVKGQLKALLEKQPVARKALEEVSDPDLKKQIGMFLEEDRLAGLEVEFTRLAQGGDDLDLEQGAALLAAIDNPQLTRAQVSKRLDRLSLGAEAALHWPSSPSERLARDLARYLFETEAFHGNVESYYDPANSYIDQVLARKTGNPILLSCLYLFVARRLKMNAYGIGLPGHFIVGHSVPRGVLLLDPFNKGRPLTLQACEKIVRRHGLTFRREFLDPTPNRQILARMIVNLINNHNEQGDAFRSHWLTRYLEIIQE